VRRAVSSPPSPSAAAWATATRSRCAGEGGSEGHNRRAALERQQRVTGMRPDCPKSVCVSGPHVPGDPARSVSGVSCSSTAARSQLRIARLKKSDCRTVIRDQASSHGSSCGSYMGSYPWIISWIKRIRTSGPVYFCPCRAARTGAPGPATARPARRVARRS
jgi:hypothetical protein